eukprot:Hpha_TRINITY_DN13433_c0_g1::TRINITY_DN13433_c0_g1_i3::g.130885::m.130885
MAEEGSAQRPAEEAARAEVPAAVTVDVDAGEEGAGEVKGGEAGEEGAPEPKPPKTPKTYQKKRTCFAVPDGYEKIDVTKILKPKPGSTLSGVWRHVDTYGKAGEPHLSMCKCCGSNIKNEPLRSSTVLQHFEHKAAIDHGHWCVLQLVKGNSGQNQSQLRLLTVKKTLQCSQHWKCGGSRLG